jgi:hypothetical protein
MLWLFGSITGEDQTPPPDGAYRVTPLGQVPSGLAGGIV